MRVLRKRRDGFHEIRTLFQALDHCDELTLIKIPKGIEMVTRAAGVPADETNLCVRAARRMQAFMPRKKAGVRIILKKQIPVAAGLGGGSSDAASTMLGLMRLWGFKLSPQRLLKEGARIGSDIPFFLAGHSVAWGRGRGERITPVKQAASFWALVATPNTPVSTKVIYSRVDSVGMRTKRRSVEAYVRSIPTFDIFKSIIFNDLEKAAMIYEPAIKRLISCMRSVGGQAVGMSGSGPSVYALFPTQAGAVRMRNRLRKLYKKPLRVFIAKTL